MHKTAKKRKMASTPLVDAYAGGAVSGRILDFGCGYGADVEFLREEGFKAEGYDPNTPEFSKMPRGKFNTVMCTYVLNVVDNPEDVLAAAWKYVKKGGRLVVTCRSKADVDYAAARGCWKRVGHGWETSRGSYQEGYTLNKLIGVCTSVKDDRLGLYSTLVNGNPMVVMVKL